MQFPRIRSLRGRVVFVVAGLATVLALISVGALVGQERADASSTRVTEQALPALVAVERLERAFIVEQNAARGYVLTGRDDLLVPFRSAPAVIAGQEAVLRDTMVAHPEVVEQLDAVLRSHRAWHEVVRTSIAYKTAARQSELDRLLAERPGTPLFERLRVDTAGLRALIEGQVDADRAEVDAVRGTLTWLLGGAIVVAALSVALAARGIRRSVTRPLTALVDAVELVADGELEQAVPTAGPPEFAAVGEAVDRMRIELNERRRTAVLAAQLGESDRVGAELRTGVVRRLFGISTALTGLAARHPSLAGDLGWPIGELDQAIRDVRSAATGVPRPSPGPPPPLVGRIADLLARAPVALGVHPDLQVKGSPAGDAAEVEADELVAALDGALDALVATHARVESMAVDLAATEAGWILGLDVRGTVLSEWAARMRAGAGGHAVDCRVDEGLGHALVEWSVHLIAEDLTHQAVSTKS